VALPIRLRLTGTCRDQRLAVWGDIGSKRVKLLRESAKRAFCLLRSLIAPIRRVHETLPRLSPALHLGEGAEYFILEVKNKMLRPRLPPLPPTRVRHDEE
jgi:hypothetical protein